MIDVGSARIQKIYAPFIDRTPRIDIYIKFIFLKFLQLGLNYPSKQKATLPVATHR